MATLALRVDVDTFDGAIEGVPNLLRIFERARVRASFFCSVGPDRWGRAALRVFTRPGFLAKALRTRAPSLYPTKTLFRGTLLPSRDFREIAPLLRSIETAGHEVGLHAWDHVRWQDSVPTLSREEVARELDQGVAAFGEIFGRAPRSIAAPGWVVSDAHLLEQDRLGLDYASDGRGAVPFVRVIEGRELATIQVPTTLPTIDEMLGRDGTSRATLCSRIVEAAQPGRDEVYVLHTEVEGRGYQAELADLLDRFAAAGWDLGATDTIARAARARRADLPRQRLAAGTIAGRSGLVGVVT